MRPLIEVWVGARKPRKKRTRLFIPAWLQEHDWLEMSPRRSQAEWEERPDEDPDYVTCAACHAFPRTAHKDVIFKHPAGKKTLRIDKIRAHCDHIAHSRAVTQWRARMKEVPAAADSPAPPPADRAGVALGNLVRTIMTCAVNKCSISLVSELVKLQAANQTLISTSHEHRANGVQSFIHAASLLLQQQQNDRLRAAGFFSDMGDGSTDRKMIEQVPVVPPPPHRPPPS